MPFMLMPLHPAKLRLVFLIGVFGTPSLAQAYTGAFEGFGSQATDGPSPSVFLLNPAAFLPGSSGGGFAFGIAESLRTHEVEQVDSSATNDVSTKSKRRDFAHAAGFMVSPGSGLGLGITVKQHNEEVRSTNDNSRYFPLPVEEKWVRREAQGRFNLEFTKNFRLGAGFRYQYFRGDVLGSFNLPPEEMSTYKGTLYGATVGAQMVFTEGGFGLAYLTPLRGKVAIQGESKVTTDPGVAQVTGHWQAASTLLLGFQYARHFHEKDELAEPTTGPNVQNQTRISLLGLSPERRFLALQTIGVGFDWRFASKLGLRVTPQYEQGEYVFSTESDPKAGEKENEKNVAKYYRAKAAFLLYDKAFELQVGAEFASRKLKVTNDNDETESDTFKAQELHSFAAVNLVF